MYPRRCPPPSAWLRCSAPKRPCRPQRSAHSDLRSETEIAANFSLEFNVIRQMEGAAQSALVAGKRCVKADGLTLVCLSQVCTSGRTIDDGAAPWFERIRSSRLRHRPGEALHFGKDGLLEPSPRFDASIMRGSGWGLPGYPRQVTDAASSCGDEYATCRPGSVSQPLGIAVVLRQPEASQRAPEVRCRPTRRGGTRLKYPT